LLKGKFTFGTTRTFGVLADLDLDIYPGEFVGVMGRNGAGKSTLLKLMAGIYTPTTGTINIKGTIAPLIELGAGFSGDLSGYENIFLNAAILGFGRKATLTAVPDIIDFSELNEMIHMPVKNYSTGMLMRLGFSIATHLPAPILLVDEILAVGDAGFQVKCLQKIHSLHKDEGRTIILITHNSTAVRDNCSRCVIIDGQKKIYDGTPTDGTHLYMNTVGGAE
jgi:ABC-type polysaccharide/polyol phosphate transport system ATPase subunit